jgi:hypothetical protein
MIEQEIPGCALGLSTDTLSAWHDGGFQGADEQRIRQHATTCAACQHRLDGFATVARALERQQELEPGDRIWRGVQNRIASQRRAGFILSRPLGWSWQGVVSVASVILVVGLLAYVFNAVQTQRSGPAPASTATSAVTPTLTSSATTLGPRLVWQQAHFPSGIEATDTSRALAPLVVAPGNGDVAYLCVAPSQGETNGRIYVTRDRGQTWTRGGDIPVGAQPQSNGKAFLLECRIMVDATRPDTTVVETEWLQLGEDSDISRISSFASFDYGAHWRKLVYPTPFAIGPKMASYQSAIFASGAAQILSHDQTQNRDAPGLWISRDQMKTWLPLTLPSNTFASDFWLNPSTGALLIAANRQGSNDSLLFSSVAGGARWTQLPAPSTSGITWVVQPPQGAAPWRICGAVAPSPSTSSQPQGNTLTCSSDSGQTWTTRSALNLAQNSPKGFQFYASVSVFALASDGAVLATAMAVTATSRLYRLPTGSAVWQDLGSTPTYSGLGPTYSPTSTGGALWLSGSEALTATYPSV